MVRAVSVDLRPPDQRRRVVRAFAAFAIFGVGGFAIAVGSYVVFWEVTLFWDHPSTLSLSEVLTMGVPFIGVAATFYGYGFASAYLSAALIVSASAAAVSVWRLDRIPVTCLVCLLLACPAIVFLQAESFGITFDPLAETDDDALTGARVLMHFTPLMLPSLIGAWLLVRRLLGRRTLSDDATDLEGCRDRAPMP